MDTIYRVGIQVMDGYVVTYGHEVLIKYEKLLDEKRFNISFPRYFKNHATYLFHSLDKMFAYYKSPNVCDSEGFVCL
jgi:hypothetical protein